MSGKKLLALSVMGAFAYVAIPHNGGIVGGVTTDAKVTSSSESAFIGATLADLGAPDNHANAASLASWFPHEGTAAENNPMASTMREPGSTTFNYDGVQNYVSASQGAQATAATLANGRYPGIVQALRSGRGLCGDPSLAGEFLVWSGNGYSGVC